MAHSITVWHWKKLRPRTEMDFQLITSIVCCITSVINVFSTLRTLQDFIAKRLKIGGVEENPGPGPRVKVSGKSNDPHMHAASNATMDDKAVLPVPIHSLCDFLNSVSIVDFEVETFSLKGHHLYAVRLATFATWTQAKPRPIQLARAGFSFVNGRTVCFFCRIEVVFSDTDDNQNPLEIHRQKSPSCPFLNNRVKHDCSLQVYTLCIEDYHA